MRNVLLIRSDQPEAWLTFSYEGAAACDAAIALEAIRSGSFDVAKDYLQRAAANVSAAVKIMAEKSSMAGSDVGTVTREKL
jgi:cellobiose-specific phosphotransferase system component IIA